MARSRHASPSAAALRQREYRERKRAGLKTYRVAVDLDLARAAFDADDDERIGVELEQFVNDSLERFVDELNMSQRHGGVGDDDIVETG